MTDLVSPQSWQPEGGTHLLVFRLDDNHYALDAAAVDRVTWMVRVTPLPRAPELVLGMIDAHGRVLPVIDLRKRFGLLPRAAALDDRLILARTARRPLALAVDRVDEVIDYPEGRIEAAERIVPGVGYLRGVARLSDGLVLIQDLDSLLSLDEEEALDEALEDSSAAGRPTDEGIDDE